MTDQRLLGRVRDAIRVRHYSINTEKTYCYWVRAFIRFHDYQSLEQITTEDIPPFLTYLAVKRNVSAATQNQVQKSQRNHLVEVLGLEMSVLSFLLLHQRDMQLPH